MRWRLRWQNSLLFICKGKFPPIVWEKNIQLMKVMRLFSPFASKKFTMNNIAPAQS